MEISQWWTIIEDTLPTMGGVKGKGIYTTGYAVYIGGNIILLEIPPNFFCPISPLPSYIKANTQLQIYDF